MNYDDTLETLLSWHEDTMKKIPLETLETYNLRTPDKWELKVVDPFGRCLVAKENIREGEVIFIDRSIITGPKQSCDPICLGCYKNVDVSNLYKCSSCNWPVCGPECEIAGYHPLECAVYARSGYKPNLEDFGEENPPYESMLPLRCLLIQEKYPQNWKTLMALESHDELRKGTELWEIEQKNVVEFLREKVQVNYDETFIHKVSGVLDVNCHEVRSNIPDTKEEIRIRGVYPFCAMMSHDCSSNTHHTMMDNMDMLVVASRNIPKGHQISGTYTHLLSGTIERRKHLKYGKFFDCVCERCKDRTELGTYFSALLCSKNKCNGNVLPVDPLHPENKTDFVCDKCGYEVSNGIVSKLTNMVYRELQAADNNNPDELEAIFRKYQKLFHPNHFHLVGIKHSLGQVYGRVNGFLIDQLSASQSQRKIDCCYDLLDIIDKIDPGISRLRGLTLYELHAPILLRANRAFQNTAICKTEFLQTLNECLAFLQNTIRCLRFEPLSSFEGQICKITRNSSEELSKWIQIVEDLPDSKFLAANTKNNSFEEELTLAGLLKKIEGY